MSQAKRLCVRHSSEDSSESSRSSSPVFIGESSGRSSPVEVIDLDVQVIRMQHKLPGLIGKLPLAADCDYAVCVEKREFKVHQEFIRYLCEHRKVIKDIVEKNPENKRLDLEGALNTSGFADIVNYVYFGEVDLSPWSDEKKLLYSIAAAKLSLIDLIRELYDQVLNKMNLEWTNIDKLYELSKFNFRESCADHERLQKKVRSWLDSSELDLKEEITSDYKEGSYTYKLNQAQFVNYIQFFLPDEYYGDEPRENYTYTVEVQCEGDANYQTILKVNAWSNGWQWFFFQEKKVLNIRITCDEKRRANDHFSVTKFHCKLSDKELKFQQRTGYLVPKHNILLYPEPKYQFYFSRPRRGEKDERSNLFTYAMSSGVTLAEKQKQYFYHHFDPNSRGRKYLEFYLCQTCIVGGISIHLWDIEVNWYYKFEVFVKDDTDSEEDENWEKIGTYEDCSRSLVEFTPRPVRWIRVKGIKGPKGDTEFAIFSIECPAKQKV